ncbi:hypothetical protein KP509_14G092700 [Ceratopteris richardii]|uniref:Uncharacterized protein n=1 Tax=Ceratopteris richardii TaxID=49495 RepID=A0A8T2TFK2_CERRI|nr:hypothetical protein KP509_14G092700 [Ceratopteris richardii]
MMNRESSSESGSRQASQCNYLACLFLSSFVLITLLPYMGGIMVTRRSKKDNAQDEMTVNKYNERAYSSLSSVSYLATIPSSNYLNSHIYSTEGKCFALEALVLDLQKVVQIEREKTLLLGNEVRVLQISESFLKDRIQYLEERRWESRKGSSYSASMELLLQNTVSSNGKKDDIDTLEYELFQILQAEKDRISSLEKEISILQKSETILIERVEKLEAQLSSICKHLSLCDS